ncbi:transglutaminase family protein [Mariprofundus ferrooxydans]|uniref:transglutaminase family protein n=1 Tax=Mariprofundus ferrooxydans TaxID=314344 RepID=UPI001430116C|nr:transglutaminase family protein [Mariprofundus ferrooxydans]
MILGEGDHVTLAVKHKTTIRYSCPVIDAHNELRMSPVNTGLQQVLSHTIAVTPNTLIKTHSDHFGNQVAHFNLLEPHDSLEIIASSTVETTNAISCGPESEPDALSYKDRWLEFLQWSPGVPELPEYGSLEIPRKISMTMDDIEFGHALYEMACYFFNTFRYDPDVTHVHSSPRALFEHGGGVCQDMAHAMIGVLRLAGIPARYVSGYIFDPAHGEVGDHLRGAAATHAWVQAWHEGYGWMGVDPTNEKLVDWQYVRTAIGRDYFDVPPNRGTFRGEADQAVDVAVHINLVTAP